MSRQRYEDEIEEILASASESAPEHPNRNSDDAPRPGRRSPSPGRWRAAGAFGLRYQYPLLAGIGLIVISSILHWLYFFIAGLALVVAGYIIYYRAPRGGRSVDRTQRIWRGRSIDPEDPAGRRRPR